MTRNAVAFEVPPAELRIGQKNPAGAYCFYVAPEGLNNATPGERIGIEHACPCGCGALTALWFRGKGPIGKHDEWDVTGEWPRVTLSPSIGIKYDAAGNLVPGFHWHGYLRNGVFEEC